MRCCSKIFKIFFGKKIKKKKKKKRKTIKKKNTIKMFILLNLISSSYNVVKTFFIKFSLSSFITTFNEERINVKFVKYSYCKFHFISCFIHYNKLKYTVSDEQSTAEGTIIVEITNSSLFMNLFKKSCWNTSQREGVLIDVISSKN